MPISPLILVRTLQLYIQIPVANTLIAPIFAFYYFGIKRSGGGMYQICIDCNPNDRTWQDIDGLNRTDDGKNPPVYPLNCFHIPLKCYSGRPI